MPLPGPVPGSGAGALARSRGHGARLDHCGSVLIKLAFSCTHLSICFHLTVDFAIRYIGIKFQKIPCNKPCLNLFILFYFILFKSVPPINCLVSCLFPFHIFLPFVLSVSSPGAIAPKQHIIIPPHCCLAGCLPPQSTALFLQ